MSAASRWWRWGGVHVPVFCKLKQRQSRSTKRPHITQVYASGFTEVLFQKANRIDDFDGTLASALNVAASPKKEDRGTLPSHLVQETMEENQTRSSLSHSQAHCSDPAAATFGRLTSFQIGFWCFTNHPLWRHSGKSIKGRRLRRSCGLRGSRRGAASVHFCPLYTRCHLVTSWDSTMAWPPVSVEPDHAEQSTPSQTAQKQQMDEQ